MHFTEGVLTIHIGHINELPYFSTEQLHFATIPTRNSTILMTSETNCALFKGNDVKRKRNAYMREYRKKRKTVGGKEKTNAYLREYRKKGPGRNREKLQCSHKKM